ncbi:MAG: type III pantothenate kinase, partial [Leeuwenhoekiella sp.]
LDHRVKVPFKNLYETPTTLGVDRVALMAAAVKNHPGQNVLVIDTGTCVTYDFKNKKEEYLGGSISPGLSMRFKALHQFTANLPLLTSQKSVKTIGKNTSEAIQSGVIYGISHEINGVINSYIEDYPDIEVILTGGDALFLSKTLKNGIFAHQNFLLEGLDYIMVFNTTQ